MLVIPSDWMVAIMSPGSEKVVTLEKFLDVAIPRNCYSAAAVDAFRAARKRIADGEVVDGADINLKGLKFRRV